MNSKVASIQFILYWVMFAVYYTSGIALSSFWQIWCKFGINFALFLSALYAFYAVTAKFDKFISLSALSFFDGMSVFYIIAFLLFNFFELAINEYVGYVFLGLMLACLITSIFIIYGRKTN